MAQDWAQNRQGGQRREQNVVKHRHPKTRLLDAYMA